MHLNSKISFKNIHLCLTTLFFTETLVRHNLKQNEALSTCTESVYLSHCLSPSLCHCLSPSLSLSLSLTHTHRRKKGLSFGSFQKTVNWHQHACFWPTSSSERSLDRPASRTSPDFLESSWRHDCHRICVEVFNNWPCHHYNFSTWPLISHIQEEATQPGTKRL